MGIGLGGNATIFMKVALFGCDPKMANAGSGTYSGFRDCASPFGLAPFYPMFTSKLYANIGTTGDYISASVAASKYISIVESAAVVAGIIIYLMIPKIYSNKEQRLNVTK